MNVVPCFALLEGLSRLYQCIPGLYGARGFLLGLEQIEKADISGATGWQSAQQRIHVRLNPPSILKGSLCQGWVVGDDYFELTQRLFVFPLDDVKICSFPCDIRSCGICVNGVFESLNLI